jgi:RNA polymerase sigma-70 factor, ECF subfamily
MALASSIAVHVEKQPGGLSFDEAMNVFEREFHFARMLEAQIPRLRRYACALTRDVVRADDLVQDCLTRAVAKQHLWQYGTNLRAWLFTILHNQYVNDVRRSVREGATVELEEEAPQLTVQPNAIPTLQLRDLKAALGRLLPEQRQVILLVGLEGMSYGEVASVLNAPVGTVRSRLSRGRDQLRRLMGMEEEERASRQTSVKSEPEERGADNPTAEHRGRGVSFEQTANVGGASISLTPADTACAGRPRMIA